MTCSSWKISIFGILALMLAFGLAAPDAWAAKTRVGVAHDKNSNDTGDVYAGAQVDITFTVQVSDNASEGDDNNAGTVSIDIPSVWSRPFATNSATVDEVGEVVVGTTVGTGDTVLSGAVKGRRLVASIGKDTLSQSITFVYRTIAPTRTGVYKMAVSSGTPGTHDVRAGDGSVATAALSQLTIVVGPARVGGGKVELAPLKAQPDTDPNTFYETKYTLFSEEVLSNLKVTYTAPGTMPKDSKIKFTSQGFAAFTRKDDKEIKVTLSGNGSITKASADHAERSVAVTVGDVPLQSGSKVVFSIPSHYKAAKIAADGTSEDAVESGWTINVTTEIPGTSNVAGSTVNFGAQSETSVGAAPGTFDAHQFDFITTKPPGTGKLVVYDGDSQTTNEFKYAATGADIAATTLRFTFSDLRGIGDGATYEIELPGAFPIPFDAISGTANGTTTTANAPSGTSITFNDRKISGSFPDSNSLTSGLPTITYRLDKAPAEGEYTFLAKGSAGHHTAMAAMGSPKLEVTVGKGKGALSLTRQGQVLDYTTSEKDLGNLVFTYTAGGRMASGSTITIANATDWTPFRSDNGDGVVDAGEVKLASGSADLTSLTTTLITATTNKVLMKGDKITFNYNKVKAPESKNPASYTFQGQDNSYPGETPLANTASSPSVGIGRAPDGAGTIALSKSQADAGSALTDFTITYAATGTMNIGSQVEVSVPDNWTSLSLKDFSTTPDDVDGRVTLANRSSSLVVDSGGKKMTATTQIQLGDKDVIQFIIKKATAPTADGQYTFSAKSTSDPSGTLTALSAGGDTLTVSAVAAGTMRLASATGPLASAVPGMALGNLAFTFTAGTAMESGAQVQVTIPQGWSVPFLDNNDGVEAAGEVSISGMANLSVSGGGAQPWMLTATTTAALDSGATFTIAYKNVTAPQAELVYTFATTGSLRAASAGGVSLSLAASPTVTVRTPVTAIAIAADATSVFTRDTVNLTVTLKAGDADGKALGAVVVNLADTLADGKAAGGTFTPASITIADNMSSGTATYVNTTAGSVTITAKSGKAPDEMSATADVEIKSGISAMSATPDPVSAGMDVTISATGEAGAPATLALSYVNADENTVNINKGLDPVGDPVDGSQAYSRTITLPSDIPEGDHTITLKIANRQDTLSFEVINDQDPPTLTAAAATPVGSTTAANGGQVALSVMVAMNSSNLPITTVTADVSKLDSTRADAPISLTDTDGDGTYTAIFSISDKNTAADGDKMVLFTATDRIGNANVIPTIGETNVPDKTDPAVATIRLRNDTTKPVLSMASATSDRADNPGMARNGDVITISVTSEAGLTVTADATSIGGGATVPMDANGNGAMDANGNGAMDANGNGAMDANGNGAMDANGNGAMDANGNGAMDANGNGAMDANGNGAMDANGNGAMDANGNGTMDANGNGDMSASVTYTGTVPVTGAGDGVQMITITAMDISGNTAEEKVSVTVDNTAPTVTASAAPASAANGKEVTISVTTETGATVTADASAIGGGDSIALAESATAAGSYSGTATVTDATDGEQMISITATDALDNASDAVMVSVTVDNTAPALSMASVSPAEVVNGDEVTISVTTETGATVTADASAIGVTAAIALAESATTAGSYSGTATVNVTAGVDMAISITATDALGNASEAASATVSVHEVTSASFSPMEASTGDMVTVIAMGTAGLKDVGFSVGDIVKDHPMSESPAGTYTGSFKTVIDVHPEGVYSVSVNIGVASMTAEGSLTIDHLSEFTLTIPAGVHLIHIPLNVAKIGDMPGTIGTVVDLYKALSPAVNFIISLDADGKTWNSYLGAESAGSAADAAIGADTGLVAVMKTETTLKLAGTAHGEDGKSSIMLKAGTNLVGVPLDPTGLNMISDGLAAGATSIVVSDAAGEGFLTISQAGDPGDGPFVGGRGYIVIAAADGTIDVEGQPWEDAVDATDPAGGDMPPAAPSIGIQTPALHVQGKLLDNAGMLTRDGLTVSVRNVTSGTTLGSETVTDEYSMTFVKLDTHAAKVGDVIEIKADSSNPLLGIRPVQYVVTSEDVLTSRISLPDLVTYEIPAQTELLANYPNPFNPETWIPFRLAKDASVTLTIYGTYGDVVRNIDIGFTPAAVYEGRSDAIYWDGRNDFGEQVASGIYFYHLHADDFSATRKMVIVK